MDELLKIRAPKPSPKLTPQPAKKKIPVTKRTTVVKCDTRPKMLLSDRAKYVSIKAYLDSDKHAFFLNKKDPTKDYFYECLTDLKTQHLTTLDDLDGIAKYNSSFTSQGFSFKSAKRILSCFDLYDNPTMWHDLIGKKVDIKLKVVPYNFTPDNSERRLAGLSIKVSEIRQCRY